MEEKKLTALTFAPDVVRTAATDAVIFKLDAYFARANHPARITSVLRDSASQLRIIQDYAVKAGLLKPGEALDMTTTVMFEDHQVYRWQLIWSQLLNRGIIINPPVAAAVLMDYWSAGVNKKGTTIQPSEHFLGTAFDIGGAGNGCDDEFAIIALAKKEGIGIKYIRIEHGNNCVHSAV